MNSEQAKSILRLYRPGTAAASDPQFAEALDMARRDPELDRFLTDHIIAYRAIQERLQGIPVAAGLRERILASRPQPTNIIPWQPAAVLSAMAALFVLVLGLSAFLSSQAEQEDFTAYRSRMARQAMRGYPMSLVTNSLTQIRSYLTEQGAPSNYVISPALAQDQVLGCGKLRWNDHPVSLLCFQTANKEPLWLFVTGKASIADAPAGPPLFAKVGRLTTFSWSKNGIAYVLAGELSEADLRERL